MFLKELNKSSLLGREIRRYILMSHIIKTEIWHVLFDVVVVVLVMMLVES
jgi:hypothetical protein